MRRRVTAVVAGAATALLVAGFAATPASGAPRPTPTPNPVAAPGDMDSGMNHRNDNMEHPLGEEQERLRAEAMAKLLSGSAMTEQRNGSEVLAVSGDRYVEVQKKTKTDPIFTILVEFGEQVLPTTGGDPGPRHNQIPAPDREWDGGETDDNRTIWAPDFSRDYFQKLLFDAKKPSMTSFYLDQSGGRYTVGGAVSDWVTVPFNEARYGSNQLGDDEVYWPFIADTAQAWYDAQVAAGKSVEEIREYLSDFDIWDRYDYDGDGDFNEPDGYIDHFQAVHAGEGEEAGGGAQGEDAIWSHRWYAFPNGIGEIGPDFNRRGGAPLGDSGIWVGDYTTEPENGGLGVFAHEYGHDLGLPDLYDTHGGENGTAFWTLMSSGSWLNNGGAEIGSTPGYLGPWEKLVLGWLDYAEIGYGSGSHRVTLGPAGDNDGRRDEAVVVNLPPGRKITEYNTPYSGEYEWWSGSADDMDVKLTRTIDLTGPVETAALTAKGWWSIEEGYDFLVAEVSTDDGATWAPLGDRIDAESGDWQDLRWSLTSYAGEEIQFRFRYYTDGGTHLAGAFLDDISLVLNGSSAWTDDVESGETQWDTVSWTRFTGTLDEQRPRFYIAENRQYVGYDRTLKVGPYNFPNPAVQPNWVERFPFQNGLLVWNVDYTYDDNNVIDHPGRGLALPVDARPLPIIFPGGCDAHEGNPEGVCMLTNRRQPFDATFGAEWTDKVTFKLQGQPVTLPKRPGIRTFDDTDPNRYWSPTNPWGSTKVAGTGTKIEVKKDHHKTMVVRITSPAPPAPPTR